MDVDVSSLPDDSAELKEIIISLAASRADLEEKEHSYQSRIDYLQERIRLLQNELFGRKTEKLPKEDLPKKIATNCFFSMKWKPLKPQLFYPIKSQLRSILAAKEVENPYPKICRASR